MKNSDNLQDKYGINNLGFIKKVGFAFLIIIIIFYFILTIKFLFI